MSSILPEDYAVRHSYHHLAAIRLAVGRGRVSVAVRQRVLRLLELRWFQAGARVIS